MVRGRPVNPSYRYAAVSLDPASTIVSIAESQAEIYAETTGYADSQFYGFSGSKWRIDTAQHVDVSIKSTARARATILTSDYRPSSPSGEGSIMARMRPRARIRTGA